MKQFLLIFLLLVSLFVQAQRRTSLVFKATIINKQDTISHPISFYIIEKEDTVYPIVRDKYFILKLKDSLVDFCLHHKGRVFIFKDVDAFRLLSDDFWEIHLDEKASDTSYSIINRDIVCFPNVNIGGKNEYSLQNFNGKVELLALPINRIYVSYFNPRKRIK